MEPSSFEKSLMEVQEGTGPLRYGQLSPFSNMNREELARFKEVWARLDADRQYGLLSRMAGLAEENVEVNFDSIMLMALDSPDDRLRVKAIEGLWENRDISLLHRLADMLRHDRAAAVRAAAATALGAFAMLVELQEIRPSHGPTVRQALLASFNDQHEEIEVRRRALEAMSPMCEPEVMKVIEDAYSSGNRKLKASAVYAMGRNCDQHWLPMLREELESADREMRCEAAGACGEVGDESAVPLLVPLLEDPDMQVRLAAIEAIGRLGGDQARAALRQCLRDPDGAVREAAADALEEIKACEGGFLFGQN